MTRSQTTPPGRDEAEELVIEHRTVTGEDFTGRRFSRFVAHGARFVDCRFDDSVFENTVTGAGRVASEYVGCSFDRARMVMSVAGYARFEGSSFEDTTIDRWFCMAVELVDCTFSGKLRKAFFNGRVPERERVHVEREMNQFEGNDFYRATLVDVDFRGGIDLTRQRLPQGEGYFYLTDAAAAVVRARAAVAAWSEVEEVNDASGVLDLMEENVAGGQRQLLLRADDYPRSARPAIRRMLESARGDG